MTEYRYQRMASNNLQWIAPHSERLGKTNDHVPKSGFVPDDWNFAKDIWDDGKYHLFLQHGPNQNTRGEVFNIVLGAHGPAGSMVAGFAENVSYTTASLNPAIWRRRAKELDALDAKGGISGDLAGLNIKQKIKALKAMSYDVAVAPHNLIILDAPILIPEKIYTVSMHAYRPLLIDKGTYEKLKKYALEKSKQLDFDDESFPEGRIREYLHKTRERNQHLVKKAKTKFIGKHGSLFCEACEMTPTITYEDQALAGRIIEAHHDIPISSEQHSGKTKISDLRMLCPNCHRVIHALRPWLTVDDLKEKIEKQREKTCPTMS